MNIYHEKIFTGFENELNLYYCGKRYRSISHHYGPYTENRYLIYYIKEGDAELKINNKKMKIGAKGLFVNFPNSKAEYRCSENSIWTIKWIMADGESIEKYLSLLGVTWDNPYIKLDTGYDVENVFDEMYDMFDKDTLGAKIYCISLIHKLFSVLAEKNNNINAKNNYILLADKEIEKRFCDPDFNVSELAKTLGLHYNYFSIIYKKEKGITPINAINTYRIKNACKMLKFTNKSIKDIAHNCGYTDELYFSRMFSKKMGMSPTAYRISETVYM